MDSIYKILESLDQVNENKESGVKITNIQWKDPEAKLPSSLKLNITAPSGSSNEKIYDLIHAELKDEYGEADDFEFQFEESLQEGQYDGKSREELLKMKADAEESMKNMQSSGSGPQEKFYDETQMMMAQQHLDSINDALKKVGESVEEAEITPIDHSEEEDGASADDIASAITRRMMAHPKFGALVREVDILDLNDAIEEIAQFHEGGDLGTSDVSNMVNDVLKQLGKPDALKEEEAVTLDQAREYFFDKHDFADENIQGEYEKMASKMSSKDAMTLKKELEEFYPDALNEEDIEENAFNTERDKAIAAGQSSFTFNGKTYPVKGKDKEDVERAKERFSEDEDSMPASPDEGGMAGDQAEFIKYAVDEIKTHIENGGDFPEWFQNKMSDVYGKMKDLHGYMEGDKRNDADDEVEEVEETTVSGGIATSATGKGIYKNASVYESMNSKVESMITESMNVSINSSNDPSAEPSVTVSATGQDAMALAQLLQLAAVDKPQTMKVCKNCGDELGKPQHMDCPYDSMDPMGENFMEVACEAEEANSAKNTQTYDMHYLLDAISGGLNGQKKQINPNNPGDNPMAMDPEKTVNVAESEETGVSHLETLYKEFKAK